MRAALFPKTLPEGSSAGKSDGSASKPRAPDADAPSAGEWQRSAGSMPVCAATGFYCDRGPRAVGQEVRVAPVPMRSWVQQDRRD
jgi:hypothetical protein